MAAQHEGVVIEGRTTLAEPAARPGAKLDRFDVTLVGVIAVTFLLKLHAALVFEINWDETGRNLRRTAMPESTQLLFRGF